MCDEVARRRLVYVSCFAPPLFILLVFFFIFYLSAPGAQLPLCTLPLCLLYMLNSACGIFSAEQVITLDPSASPRASSIVRLLTSHPLPPPSPLAPPRPPCICLRKVT